MEKWMETLKLAKASSAFSFTVWFSLCTIEYNGNWSEIFLFIIHNSIWSKNSNATIIFYSTFLFLGDVYWQQTQFSALVQNSEIIYKSQEIYVEWCCLSGATHSICLSRIQKSRSPTQFPRVHSVRKFYCDPFAWVLDWSNVYNNVCFGCLKWWFRYQTLCKCQAAFRNVFEAIN